MKIKGLSIFLLILLIVGLFSITSIIEVQGASTLNFTFEKDVLYSKSNPEFDESFNVRNQTTYTGHYPAIYSFEEINVGTKNFDIPFIDFRSTGVNAIIIQEKDGHNKVIEIEFPGNFDYIYNDFSDLVYGEIEFWIIFSNESIAKRFKMDNVGEIGELIFNSVGEITWYNGSSQYLCDYLKNVWYHVKFEINCTSDTINIFINNIKYEHNFKIPVDVFTYISFGAHNDNYYGKLKFWIDAISYSWYGDGLRNATYSFDDQPVGTSGININWVDILSGGSTCEIINSINGHDKVLNLTSGTTYSYAKNDFTQQITGTIEVWIYPTVINDNIQLRFDHNVGDAFYIMFGKTSGNIEFYNGTYTIIDTFTPNNWYHVKVVFNCTTNITDVYINGILKLSDGQFKTLGDGLIMMYFLSQIIGYEGYIDAISYSWDPDYTIGDNFMSYTIGDNIIPYLNVSQTVKEINAYSFSYTEEGIFTIAENYIPFWTEFNGTDDGFGRETIVDGRARLYSLSTYNKGFYKDDFTILDGIINISWEMEYDFMKVVGGIFFVEVYSKDTTLKIKLRFYEWDNGIDIITTMSYYDGSVYHNLTNLVQDVIYDFSLMILPINLIYLRNGTELLSVFQGITINKGLSKIQFKGNADERGDSEMEMVQRIYIDNIGIYSNGTSFSNDYMSGIININVDWDSNNYFIFESNIIGLCSISANLEVLYSNYNYFGKIFLNVWDRFTGEDIEGEEIYYLVDCNLTFVSNSSIQIISLSIDGIILTEGINEYFFDFSYSNVNINKSYFWIDSNNRLQFNLIVNDNDTEYIQARFTINDVATENRSISFASNINGDSKGFFSLDYTDDTINLMQFPYHQTTTKVILPQTKTIESFTILITDNDLSYSDRCNGYISNISLIYNPDIGITIFTLNLLGIIVPLIVMLLPPVAMRKRFGIAGVIVTFVLMSLICVISNLIPIWLFFIIVFGTIAFLLMKEKIEVKI